MQAPTNPLNGGTNVTATLPGAVQATIGWLYQVNGNTYTLHALDTNGTAALAC